MIDDKKLSQAIALLRDENLVWDKDFETVKTPIKDLLVACAVLGTSSPANISIQTHIIHRAANSLLKALVKE